MNVHSDGSRIVRSARAGHAGVAGLVVGLLVVAALVGGAMWLLSNQRGGVAARNDPARAAVEDAWRRLCGAVDSGSAAQREQATRDLLAFPASAASLLAERAASPWRSPYSRAAVEVGLALPSDQAEPLFDGLLIRALSTGDIVEREQTLDFLSGFGQPLAAHAARAAGKVESDGLAADLIEAAARARHRGKGPAGAASPRAIESEIAAAFAPPRAARVRALLAARGALPAAGDLPAAPAPATPAERVRAARERIAAGATLEGIQELIAVNTPEAYDAVATIVATAGDTLDGDRARKVGVAMLAGVDNPLAADALGRYLRTTASPEMKRYAAIVLKTSGRGAHLTLAREFAASPRESDAVRAAFAEAADAIHATTRVR
ncbi:MAG: hypothetical protein HY719_10290 [Planctomycetes bacterium]|nr:hypothetical protein [Planctomycetota bacterium]